MAMSKEEFLKWLKPIIQDMIKEHVEEYIKDVVTKLVFEKAAEKLAASLSTPASINIEESVQPQYQQPIIEQPKQQTYNTFHKFIPKTPQQQQINEQAPAPQPQRPIQNQKTANGMTQRAKMFSDIVDDIPREEVAQHRVNETR